MYRIGRTSFCCQTSYSSECEDTSSRASCFRGLVDDADLHNIDIASEYWGKRGRVGIVPLINNQAYWFITINASEKDPKYQTFEKPHLQAYFNNYPEPVRQILDKQSETGIQKHDLYDMKPLKSFVNQRILLLGRNVCNDA